MGPVRQNPIQRTLSLFICVCIALCTIVAHNIAQNRSDSFPPYPPDNHHISDDVYLREGDCGGDGQSCQVQLFTIYRSYANAVDHRRYKRCSNNGCLFNNPSWMTCYQPLSFLPVLNVHLMRSVGTLMYSINIVELYVLSNTPCSHGLVR